MFVYEPTNPNLILIHLHGFASNVSGNKVALLRERSLKGRYSFFAMDMDYHKTTTTRTLEVLDALLAGFSQKYHEIWLSGSSHGAYVLLNYMKFYPQRKIKRLFLFAPSYSTLDLTLKELGEEKCRNWLEGKEELHFVECETGLELTIHKDFAKDILQRGYEIIRGGEVYFPELPTYDIYIFHGNMDKVVPVEHSRLFVSKVKVSKYVELEDDHRLSSTFQKLVEYYL